MSEESFQHFNKYITENQYQHTYKLEEISRKHYGKDPSDETMCVSQVTFITLFLFQNKTVFSTFFNLIMLVYSQTNL